MPTNLTCLLISSLSVSQCLCGYPVFQQPARLGSRWDVILDRLSEPSKMLPHFLGSIHSVTNERFLTIKQDLVYTNHSCGFVDHLFCKPWIDPRDHTKS